MVSPAREAAQRGRGPLLLCALLCLSALVGSSRNAEACSCGGLTEEFIPAQGSTNIPLNVSLVAVPRDARGEPDVRLLDAQGAVVAGATTSWLVTAAEFPWVIFTPSAPLAANTTYTLQSSGLGATYSAEFQTGVEMDLLPSTIAVESFETSIEASDSLHGCWDNAFELDKATLRVTSSDADLTYLRVEVRTRAGLLVEEIFVPREFLDDDAGTLVFATADCGLPGILLELGTEYCATVVGYDLSGNASSPQEICAAPTFCETSAGDARCARPTGCSAGATTTGWSMPGFVLVLMLARRRRLRAAS